MLAQIQISEFVIWFLRLVFNVIHRVIAIALHFLRLNRNIVMLEQECVKSLRVTMVIT